MNRHFHIRLRRLFLPLLLCAGWAATALAVQTPEEAELEKRERAETQRLAARDRREDRELAIERMCERYMDYDLLWKFMNHTDTGTRIMAIAALPDYFSVEGIAALPLPEAMAKKISAMLEKELTPERIEAVIQSGRLIDGDKTELIICSARTLRYLYQHHLSAGCGEEYIDWQWRVPRRLCLALLNRNQKGDHFMDYSLSGLLNAISDPQVLVEVLHATMKSLDNPDLLPQHVEERLEALWRSWLLGKDGPLNLLLVAELSPRLERLAPRILSRWQEGPQKMNTRRFIKELTEAVAAAREKMTPPAAGQTDEKSR